MKRYLFVTSALFFTINFTCFSSRYDAQRPVAIEFFGVNDGLSQSSINCLLYDSNGFLWIGTQDGLNRYDGYEFKHFRNNPFDSFSLSSNYVYSLAEDENGDLWVGTWNGLSRFENKTGKFINYSHKPDDNSTISENRVYVVLVDASGTVWIKTAVSLDRFDRTTQSFVRYPHFNEFANTSIHPGDFDLLEDSQGNIWVGSKDGLLCFNRATEHFKRYSHNPSDGNSISNNRIKHIFEDSQRNLWVSTNHGLNRFQPQTDNFIRFYPGVHGDMTGGSTVNFVFELGRNKYMVGTNKGLRRFDTTHGNFSAPLVFANRGEVLPSYQYKAMIEDGSKILWIGTTEGLMKWNPKGPKFGLKAKDKMENNLFANNSIASILLDGNDLWVGTWTDGLFRYNRGSGQVQYFGQSASRPISNNYVHAVYKTSKGQLLIGVDGAVQMYDRQEGRFIDFFKEAKHRNIFASIAVNKILEDAQGRIWFATTRGVYFYDNNVLTAILRSDNQGFTLSSNEITSLAIDTDGSIWAGTFGGLNHIRVDKSSIVSYLKDENPTATSLLSNEILALHFSKESGLWVGTVNGLHRFDSSNETFTSYTERDGLPNNLINAIEEDHRGCIWVSTNQGLAMLNPKTGQIDAYGMNDGLQGYEYNLGASFCSPDGEIFFGGIQGINHFFPDSIQVSAQPSKMAFTNFEIINRGNRHTKAIVGVDEVEVAGSFSLINLEFAVFDFTHPLENRYKYRMEGLDNTWVELGNRRSVSFSHLGEGVYHLKVIGSNSDRAWNEDGIELRIVVRREFYKSRVAIIIYILAVLIITAIISIYRFRISVKTKRLLNERSQAIIKSERQKHELEVKNKSITDSINYAKRIQQAILPSEMLFKRIMPDSFILFMPKDIVSGDFYWVNETENKIFVATLDCTGHGVPGAFMSIIGVELLRNITNVQGINDAAEILNRLHFGINETFAKGIDEDVEVKDGMDVSFCVIDKVNNRVQFAGAFTSLYLIRDNKIIEIKGDRSPVGMGVADANFQFTSHFIAVEPNDMIYIFTDGYIDQFGGVENKKFKFRRFRHLLLSIHQLPLADQRTQLHDAITDWRGENEQVDDILIVGFKPDLNCFF